MLMSIEHRFRFACEEGIGFNSQLVHRRGEKSESEIVWKHQPRTTRRPWQVRGRGDKQPNHALSRPLRTTRSETVESSSGVKVTLKQPLWIPLSARGVTAVDVLTLEGHDLSQRLQQIQSVCSAACRTALRCDSRGFFPETCSTIIPICNNIFTAITFFKLSASACRTREGREISQYLRGELLVLTPQTSTRTDKPGRLDRRTACNMTNGEVTVEKRNSSERNQVEVLCPSREYHKRRHTRTRV